MEKPVILLLLQTLMDETQSNVVLSTTVLSYYIAFECHRALNQAEKAQASLDALGQRIETEANPLLESLYGLMLSLPTVEDFLTQDARQTTLSQRPPSQNTSEPKRENSSSRTEFFASADAAEITELEELVRDLLESGDNHMKKRKR